MLKYLLRVSYNKKFAEVFKLVFYYDNLISRHTVLLLTTSLTSTTLAGDYFMQ
jgi:hypothetical protein